jgi:hypothetical protein
MQAPGPHGLSPYHKWYTSVNEIACQVSDSTNADAWV